MFEARRAAYAEELASTPSVDIAQASNALGRDHIGDAQFNARHGDLESARAHLSLAAVSPRRGRKILVRAHDNRAQIHLQCATAARMEGDTRMATAHYTEVDRHHRKAEVLRGRIL